MKSLSWMAGALLSFCLMAIGARELSGELSVFQTLFIRSAIGLVFLSIIISGKQQPKLFFTQRPGLHVWRHLVHYIGQYGWFVAIGLLPLAEVFAIEFTVPLWTAIIAAVFLRERITVKRASSIMIGLIGVYLIIDLDHKTLSLNSGTAIMLAAAIFFALAHIGTKSLTRSDHAITIIFYMCLIQLPISLLFSLQNWLWPTSQQWLWLIIIGLVALSAHFCMTKAMQYADVTLVVIIDFLRLPLIALLGIVFYQEPFEPSLLFGAILMLLGNLIALYKVPVKKVSK